MDGPVRSGIEASDVDRTGSDARVDRRFFARAEERLASRVSEKSAIILVVVLSLALWAVIWGIFVAATFVMGFLPGL